MLRNDIAFINLFCGACRVVNILSSEVDPGVAMTVRPCIALFLELAYPGVGRWTWYWHYHVRNAHGCCFSCQMPHVCGLTSSSFSPAMQCCVSFILLSSLVWVLLFEVSAYIFYCPVFFQNHVHNQFLINTRHYLLRFKPES